jgi:hypothetical protein
VEKAEKLNTNKINAEKKENPPKWKKRWCSSRICKETNQNFHGTTKKM